MYPRRVKLLLALALTACGTTAGAPVEPSNQAPPGRAPPPRSGRIYVSLGAMGSNTTAGDSLAPVLHDAVAAAFRADPAFELDGTSRAGFNVDGVLTVTVTGTGRGNTIRCKLDLLVSTYPSKAIFGLPSSTAEVGATTAAAEIEAGRRDCVRAVAAGLVTGHVIPMLRKRVAEEGREVSP